MKIRILSVLVVVCVFAFLRSYPADAIIYGKRGDGEPTIPWAYGINHWEQGPGVQATVVGDVLELITDGSNTGLYFNYPNVNPAELTDYELEVSARKIGDDSKFFHLFVRTVVPTKDFYFVEVSYNSDTIAIYEFSDGVASEITPGGRAGRPKRPDSKDTVGGDHYIFTCAAEGNILKYAVDGRLSIVAQNNTWAMGPPGIGGRGGQVNYYWVRVDSLPDQGLFNIPSTDKQLSVENEETLATIWDTLRNDGEVATNSGSGYAFSQTPIYLDDTFTVDIRAENVSDLAGWQFGMTFDAAILEAIDVTEGDFLKMGGATTFFHSGTIDNASGEITGLSGARIAVSGVSGTGVLLQARFKAKSVGETELALTKFELASSTADIIPARPHQIRIVVEEPPLPEDINRDGRVSVLDLVLIAQQLGRKVSAGSTVDVNRDGVVSILDLIHVAQEIAESFGAPPVETNGVDPATIEAWIAQARLADDDSPAFKQGIKNLEKLLATLIPEKTALLANYPNPFNPETWIPYQLASPAEVVLTIYDMKGQLVRRLTMGHQAAGIYKSQSHAVYWDGCNQLGEFVASGVYFYTLTAGEFTATRRMLILK